MTIMFAGGMTIAIPGETPVAVAQTGMLSVSATAAPGNSFGGPQIIQIIVDDPSRSETGEGISKPDVSIDDNPLKMTQADTGKWYAYVTSTTGVAAANLAYSDFPDAGADAAALNGFLATDITPSTNAGDALTLQNFPFDDDSDIDVVFGDETITLHYEEDLDDLATVSTDRTNGVPVDGQVHVTVSDFRLNLDPTGADKWVMNADGELASLVIGVDDDTDNWIAAFGGLGGVFTVTDDVTIVTVAGGQVTLTETGANTGVFESQNDDDSSNIEITGDENDDFTIAYADSDVQVFIEDFDSTLKTISDGTWNSGNTITVRLTDENLNTNTLTDQDMELGDDALPMLMFGEPITLATVESITLPVTDPPTTLSLGDRLTIDENTHVGTLMKSTAFTAGDTYTFTVTLTDAQKERLQDDTLGNYIHYSSELTAATNAHLNGTTPDPTTTNTPVENGARIIVDSEADGIFNITFAGLPATAPDGTPLDDDAVTANDGIRTAVTAAIDAGITTADDVRSNVESSQALPAFMAEVATNTDTDVGDAKAAVMEIALKHIVTHDFAIAADIFTFGDGTNHAIYRALLEETDSASGVFEGTIEYQMLNQRTEADPPDKSDANGASDELVMILDKDYTGSDAPEVLYDTDGPGGDEPANASEDAPTNTGEVSVDASIYRVSDDVTITLVDADLNTDSGAREIYRIANNGSTIEPRLASIAIGDLICRSEIGDVSLRETASDSGVFEGSFTVPSSCGTDNEKKPILTTGESITVTYEDFRDETGAGNQWTDSATIGADTGSVSLDRTVYPVPPPDNVVTITVSVDDADEDTSSSSRETISGVKLTVAGMTFDLDELKETEPDSGIFEDTVKINSTANRPNTEDNRIEQGDIITVKYTDVSDASGNKNSVSDSATFDLRNAVLQSDKSVYVIGQDALLTLIEADLNLDSGTIDNIGLDLINWDSDAYDGSLAAARTDLGPVPTNLRETGENTGIFQVVITISEKVDGTPLERGEEITLTYNDLGPSGADYVTDDDRDVELQIETSNFGATVELDQNVYTWTDKVFITVVASDYNFDSNIVDEIGSEGKGEITIRTRADELQYRLAETGPDTGVFTGELVLTGDKEALKEGGPQGMTSDSPAGPTDGIIKTRTADGISISFDYSDSEAPLVASALIRWNVGEVQWLEASYAATGSGVVRIIDPDMNINPDAVDSIDAVVYSETFIGGIELTLTETQEASGIFEGTVEFDPESASDGHRLQVTEGDIITAAYDDETLPKPDNGDTLEITATTLIGSIVPPLERAPASNPAIVDAFGNSLASVSADQQVQITADLTSGQDRDQDFAYLVQIQNEDGVTDRAVMDRRHPWCWRDIQRGTVMDT